MVGGIEAYAAALSSRLPGDVVVVTRAVPGSDGVDAAFPHPVVRLPASPLLPSPRLARALTRIAVRHRVDRAWIASAAPLGLLGPALRSAGARRIVASTHGHEVWWASVPGPSALLRRIAAGVDVLTYVSGATRDRIAAALPPAAAERMRPLFPGVDTAVFAPDPAARRAVRAGLGIAADAPTVLAAARLVRRKGVDTLLGAWPAVRRSSPAAALVVVGDGPDRGRVARLAAAAGGRGGGVHLVGARPWREMPRWYAAADVFALPVRTRLWGLEPEAFGICYLEAAAAGLPVVAGRSGGTGEAVADGVTGLLVDGTDVRAAAGAVSRLVCDAGAARLMGVAGRESAVRERSWEASAALLRDLLDPRSGPDPAPRLPVGR